MAHSRTTSIPLPALRRCAAAALLAMPCLGQAAEPATQPTKTRPAASVDVERLNYIRELEAKFASRITADSPEGRRIVANFRIDCRANDGRVLPLMYALYASIASLERMGPKMTFHIQNRGAQVRIISDATQNGKSLGQQVYYEISEWGELHPRAIRQEAVLNACYGFQGKIWLMPGEPGYK